MLYCLDAADEAAEVRVGERVYTVDDRMSAFLKLSADLGKCASRGEEFDLVVRRGLGEAAAADIAALDLSVGATQRLIVLILAAMQGITEDEAARRFHQ